LADFVVGVRGLGLSFILLGLLATASLSLLRFDFSPQTLFDTTSERAATYFKYRKIFGADDHHLMFLIQGDLRAPAAWALIGRMEQRLLNDFPEVEETWSLLSLPVPRSRGMGQLEISPLLERTPGARKEAEELLEQAAGHPLLRDHLVSADGTVTELLFKVADEVTQMAEVGPLVERLRALARDELQRSGGDVELEVELLGAHAYRSTVVAQMIAEELRFIPLTALVLALVLLVLFRSLAGVLVPLLSVLLGALLTLAAMALTGEGINIINTITATLVLVIGVADAIHMMTRYQQERLVGESREASMREALRSVGAACFLTSFTTAVGFATLLSAQLPILRSFGIYAALGVMLTFVMTIVFVPWALVRSPQDPAVRPALLATAGARPPDWLHRALSWQAGLVRRNVGTVLILSFLVSAFFVAGIPRTTVDNFIMEYVPQEHPIRAAHKVMEEKLAGIVYVDVLLQVEDLGGQQQTWADAEMLALAAQAERLLISRPAIRSTDSVLGLLREMHFVQRGGSAAGLRRDELPGSSAEIAQLLLLAELSGNAEGLATHLSVDRRLLRITVRCGDLGAQRYLALEQQLEDSLIALFEQAPASVSVTLTGTTQVGYAGIDSLIRDLLRSLSWAFVLIFVTLCLLFRSWKLAAVSMGPNLLPILAVLGTLAWMGEHLETLSAMVFSIGLGIAVDDTIHYVARYCQEVRAGLSPEEAVQRTTERSGRAILYTSAVLLLGFGVLYSSAFPPNQSFAVLAGAVIFAAVLADLFVLPAMLLFFRPEVPGAASVD
tara:strand:- start:5745 stop:8096 length:2352 start_codon:yes stop_codon:yes gene_type:complete